MENRLDALDGWRAIAALMVIASHLQAGGHIAGASRANAYGHLGVDYFFGISGFVIARGLLRPGGGDLRGFYVRRFFRIVPPLVLYLGGVMALVTMGMLEWRYAGALRALTFTCNFPGADCGGWVGGHTWSLSVEEQFYLVIPLLLALARPRWLTGLLVLAIGPAVLVLYAVREGVAAGFVANFTVIGCGVFCAIYEPWVRRHARRAPAWLAPIAFAATVVMVMCLPAARWATVLDALAFAPLILFVLMVSAFSGGWLTALLSTAPLRRLGVVSYSLYLWQQLATRDWPGMDLAEHLAAVGGCILLAFASYRWIERPLIGLGKRLAVARPGAEPVAATPVSNT